MDVCLLWVLCVCQVEVSAKGWSLVQRSLTVVCHCVWFRNLKNEEAQTRKWVVKASKRTRRIARRYSIHWCVTHIINDAQQTSARND
jgi:hypothetical protein